MIYHVDWTRVLHHPGCEDVRKGDPEITRNDFIRLPAHQRCKTCEWFVADDWTGRSFEQIRKELLEVDRQQAGLRGAIRWHRAQIAAHRRAIEVLSYGLRRR